jgi:hypothetical protein
MSQPFDWSFTQPYDEGSDEEEGVLPPPPAPKKPLRGSAESKKVEAHEKLKNYESLLDASRFLTTSLQAMVVCARDDVSRLDKRKPRAPKAAAAAEAPAAAPPAASQAATACEEAVVGKNRQGLKRVRAAVPQGAVGAQCGGGGAGAGAAMYHDAFKGRPQGARAPSSGVHTGVLGYKTE